MKYKLNSRTMFVAILATLLTSTFIIINVISTKPLNHNACKNEEGPVMETKGKGHISKI